jgi:hypothetical protein
LGTFIRIPLDGQVYTTEIGWPFSTHAYIKILTTFWIKMLAAIDEEVRVKVNSTPEHIMKVQLYSFLNLGARWEVYDRRHAPAALSPGKRPGTDG